MSIRSFAILVAITCTSCGSATLGMKGVPVADVSEKNAAERVGSVTIQEGNGTAGEITVADMECPAVDVAGSNLASNLGSGCSKASRHPATAAVVAARPNNPTISDDAVISAASSATHDPVPPVKQTPAPPPMPSILIKKPPADGPTGTLSPIKPPIEVSTPCKPNTTDEMLATSSEEQGQECEKTETPQAPSAVDSPINTTEQVIISPALQPAATTNLPRRVPTSLSADTIQ